MTEDSLGKIDLVRDIKQNFLGEVTLGKMLEKL